MTTEHTRRWRSALRLLGWVERRAGVPVASTRNRYRIDGQSAVRSDVTVEQLRRPISRMALRVADDAPERKARCSADVVRLGKFDVDDVVRFRAFHVTSSGPRSSLRVQGAAGDGSAGVERDLAARRHLQVYAPELAPQLFDHGSDRRRRVAYLRESVIKGNHPKSAEHFQQLLPGILTGMLRLYRGVGVDRQRITDVVGDRFAERWSEVTASGLVPTHVGSAVDALLARDADVEVSLGHGDLVRTNVLRAKGDKLRARGDAVLVDWEYARSMPIAFDLAKPVLLSADRVVAVEQVRSCLGDLLGAARSSYRLEEQLALGLAQILSWSSSRAARAAAAGRSEHFERDTSARIALLEELLEIR